MDSFHSLLDEIKADCGFRHVPLAKVSMLAQLCGPIELEHLIQEVELLGDDDSIDDVDIIDEHYRLRQAISRVLVEVGEPAITPLLRALNSANRETRFVAATTLGRICSKRALEPIIAQLHREKDDGCKMALIEALGELRDESATEELLPFLKIPAERVKGNRAGIVRSAASALGKIGSEKVLDPLIELLEKDPDWVARLGAVEGLSRIADTRSVKALQKAIMDGDTHVREQAVVSLRAKGFA